MLVRWSASESSDLCSGEKLSSPIFLLRQFDLDNKIGILGVLFLYWWMENAVMLIESRIFNY